MDKKRYIVEVQIRIFKSYLVEANGEVEADEKARAKAKQEYPNGQTECIETFYDYVQ